MCSPYNHTICYFPWTAGDWIKACTWLKTRTSTITTRIQCENIVPEIPCSSLWNDARPPRWWSLVPKTGAFSGLSSRQNIRLLASQTSLQRQRMRSILVISTPVYLFLHRIIVVIKYWYFIDRGRQMTVGGVMFYRACFLANADSNLPRRPNGAASQV